MEELLAGLKEKVGLDDGQAAGVIDYLKENASKIPEWFTENTVVDAVKDKIGDLF